MNTNSRLLSLLAVSLLGVAASAQESLRFGIESVGVRYGFGEGNLSHDFQEAEALVDFTLPWRWDLGRTWELKPRLELALGSFGNDHTTAFIGSAGAMLSLAPAKSPLALDIGVAPTFVSEDDFVTRSIGSEFQIRSWFGLTWAVERHVQVAYHFQHMSNGGLASNNQGLNMHTFSVSWLF